MSQISSSKNRSAVAAALLLVLASLALAACGGSSKSSSAGTGASASTSTSTSSAGAKGANANRFAAVRECLQKEGITLPKRTPGQQRPPAGAGSFLGGRGAAGAPAGGATGGPPLPKGVTRAQYEAALKKCGGGSGHFARSGKAFDSPAFKTALAKFATCLRENGVNVPAPNTSGKGPVFDTKGIDTGSAKFKAAETKCQSDLTAAFRHGSGAGGPGGPPPAGGEAPPAG
jgi:cytochrome c556